MQEDNPEVYDQIILRDYLRSHPEEVKSYSEIKRTAFNDGKTDRSEYGGKKKDFLLKLIERSKGWATQSGWTYSRSQF